MNDHLISAALRDIAAAIRSNPSVASSTTLNLLHGVIGLITTTNHKLEIIMATLQDIQNDMAEESTIIGGVSTLIAGLKQQLADILSGAQLPPAVQQKVDEVFAQAEANKAALAANLVEGTPAAGTDPAATGT